MYICAYVCVCVHHLHYSSNCYWIPSMFGETQREREREAIVSMRQVFQECGERELFRLFDLKRWLKLSEGPCAFLATV